MNWWLPVPCLHPSSLSGFQTFLCNCLLNISTWMSYRHLKLNVQNCTLIFPSQTCSHVWLIAANDSSIHLVAQAPQFCFTGPCQSWSPLAQWVAHIADVYRYNKKKEVDWVLRFPTSVNPLGIKAVLYPPAVPLWSELIKPSTICFRKTSLTIIPPPSMIC